MKIFFAICTILNIYLFFTAKGSLSSLFFGFCAFLSFVCFYYFLHPEKYIKEKTDDIDLDAIHKTMKENINKYYDQKNNHKNFFDIKRTLDKPKFIDYKFRNEEVSFHNPYTEDYYNMDYDRNISYRFEFTPTIARIEFVEDSTTQYIKYSVYVKYEEDKEEKLGYIFSSEELDVNDYYYVYITGGKAYKMKEIDENEYEVIETIYTPYEFELRKHL